MQYRPEIDGLRALAVLSVILVHAGLPWLPGGFIGVDIFFVISGYLITRIIQGELASGTFSVARFYERRARRILPALVVVVLACLPFAWAWMLPWQLEEFADSVVAVALFLSNVEFWRQSGYFATEAAAKPLLHTWSLGVEEQFYILFPLLLWALARLRRRPAAVLAVLALASLGLSEWGWRNAPDANFFLIPFRAWELLTGALAALAWGGQGRAADDRLALPGLALVLASLVLMDEQTPFPSLIAVLPVAGTAMVILWGGAGSIAGRILSWRPAVAIGLISYSAYLWHQPLFAFARIRIAGEPPPAQMALLTLATFVLAWASWKWVESPFRRRPVPVLATRRAVFAAALAAILLMVASGVVMRRVDDYGLRQLHLPGLSEDQRRDLLAGRQSGIRTGKCHFNRDVEEGVDRFIQGWSCRNDDEAGLVPLPIGVFGDSHAADKAHAIRLAGFDLAQVTGAGCPLVPMEIARPRCDALRDLFLDRMDEMGIDTVFLANRFEADELTPDTLQRIVDFWSGRFAHVYLFTPMPAFPDFDLKMQLLAPEDLALVEPDLALNRAFDAAMAGVDLKGVTLIDTAAVFCAGPAGCAPADPQVRLTDYSHLSVHGAEEFGRALVTVPGLPFPAP